MTVLTASAGSLRAWDSAVKLQNIFNTFSSNSYIVKIYSSVAIKCSYRIISPYLGYPLRYLFFVFSLPPPPTCPPWRHIAWFHERPTYILSSLTLKRVTRRKGIKTNIYKITNNSLIS